MRRRVGGRDFVTSEVVVRTSKIRSGVVGLAASVLTVCSGSSALANVVWNESLSGDLSGNRLVPSSVPTLTLGTNSVIASVDETDKDYFTITVPSGSVLSQVVLAAYASDDAIAFLGFQAGSTFTEDANNPVVANILGLAFIGTGAGNVGADILPDLADRLGSGVPQFSPPLPSGQYTFWMQQLGPLTSVQLDFIVIPSAGPSALIVAAGLLYLRRRRA
jgi:hypothetical protein